MDNTISQKIKYEMSQIDKELNDFEIQEERRRALGLSKQVCAIVSLVMPHFNLNEMDAIRLVYSSAMYRLLADETTKLWHLSVPALFEILKTECETGNVANSGYVEGLTRQ